MTQSTWRQGLARASGMLAVLLGLVGCAGLNQLSVEVSSFGAWPSQRAPGTYAIDRLPSQQVQADSAEGTQVLIESAARTALERAGFRPTPAGAQADLLVQLGARVSRLARSPWDDPLWWPGRFAQGTHRLWGGPWGPLWGPRSRFEPPRYEREVALLLRDRASGQPLYEARASSDGMSAGLHAVLPALFAAALADFPATQVSPHQVTVPLSQ